MSRSINPFSVLGFNPEALRGLDDPEIEALVKAMYRAQMQIHHTDKGGSKARSVALNQAHDALDRQTHPEEFEDWKDKFLKRRKEHLQDAVSENEKLGLELEEWKKRITNFWLAWVERDRSEELTVFSGKPARILVMNIFESRILHEQMPGWLSPLLVDKLPASEICLDGRGQLTCWRMEKVRFEPSQLRPNVPAKWIEERENPGGSYYWGRVGKSVSLPQSRLVGSVPLEALRKADYELAKLVPLLTMRGENAGSSYSGDGFPISQFAPYIPFLSPAIQRDSLLVAVQREKESQQVLFQVLGRVYAVELI